MFENARNLPDHVFHLRGFHLGTDAAFQNYAGIIDPDVDPPDGRLGISENLFYLMDMFVG